MFDLRRLQTRHEPTFHRKIFLKTFFVHDFQFTICTSDPQLDDVVLTSVEHNLSFFPTVEYIQIKIR